MTKDDLRIALAEFFENHAISAMWKGFINRKGGSEDEAQQVITWLKLWANKNRTEK